MRPKNLEKEQAIRNVALQIILEEGLENLTMQKLAKIANISPRTIYIKYENKDDLLVKLFIEEVLAAYESAVLENFEETMEFTAGVKQIWMNVFHFFKNNRTSFALMQHGKTSPLLNKAFKAHNIAMGEFFAPVHRFFQLNETKGLIKTLPIEIHRALLFAPELDLINEYFEHLDRPEQIITEDVLMDCCEMVIKGSLIK
ncbi:TetR/AcrR family transcriptional regulator [Pedobacter nototheniae]|uniref:TetR/AcrR family transcriptional regulator n=1 Tax=Pedobacter nototheniae TaxID=2488994 RepID=UPI002930153B|nr:TetR/AcrR family transcriptional regulator [Pedobacter nototheniae]